MSSRPRSYKRRLKRAAGGGLIVSVEDQKGFTLVEVLLAVALLATIAALVFASLLTTTRAIESARTAAAREQIARGILRVMADEFAVAVGRATAPWMGLNGEVAGRPADTIAFLTIAPSGTGATPKDTEFVRIVYAREGDRLLRLVRRNLYGVTDESIEQVALVENVRSFNLRYYDALGRVWLDEWDGRSRGTHPRALLIELVLQQADEEPKKFRQWVSIGVPS